VILNFAYGFYGTFRAGSNSFKNLAGFWLQDILSEFMPCIFVEKAFIVPAILYHLGRIHQRRSDGLVCSGGSVSAPVSVFSAAPTCVGRRRGGRKEDVGVDSRRVGRRKSRWLDTGVLAGFWGLDSFGVGTPSKI